jgi:alkyl hydroperoxide reductase subunit AhpC
MRDGLQLGDTAPDFRAQTTEGEIRLRVAHPIIGDAEFTVSKLYGMLPADVSGDPTERTWPYIRIVPQPAKS